MDLNRIGQIFSYIDFNEVKKNGKTDIKDLKEVVLYDENNNFNGDLLDEDKFIDAFLSSSNNAFSKEDLKCLYDAVAELDGNYKLSRADLTMLAEMANETDATDTAGNKINEADILALIERFNINTTQSEVVNSTNDTTDVEEEAFNPTQNALNNIFNSITNTMTTLGQALKPMLNVGSTSETKSDSVSDSAADKAATTTTTTEKVYDKPANMEETTTETINGNQVTTHVKYEEIIVKQEITKEEKIYETVDVEKEIPYKEDSRIKSDKNGKYVTVESWYSGCKVDYKANNCLERIIRNSYDLDAMGIKVYNKDGSYTKEFLALEKAVMDANPSIYGDENGKGGHKDHKYLDGTRHNKEIYPGDIIYLPNYSIKTGETEKRLVGTKTVGTGEYEYVSTNPPSWNKTTTITTVPLPPAPEPTPGPEGPQGPQGPQGPTGEKGDKGDPGVGIKGVDLKDGYFIFTMTDGTEIPIDASSFAGADGKDGVGIKETKLEGDKIVFIMTNGTRQEINVSGLKGADGKDGVGITNIDISNGQLIFTLSNGTDFNFDLTALKGEKGDKGDTGEKGDKGDTGRSVVRVEQDPNNSDWTIYYSEGEPDTIEVDNDLEKAIKLGLLSPNATWLDWIKLTTATPKIDPTDGNVYFWQFNTWVTDENGERIRADGEDGKNGYHIIYKPNGGTEVFPQEP